MLGSDPIAALLGAGTDPRCAQTVWKSYLRKLVGAGAAVTMLGPDVVVPDDADDAVLSALAALVATYPPGVQMPLETSGVLDGFGHVDSDTERVNRRVATYFRHIVHVLGKELAPQLLTNGAVTASAGLHVGASGMVAVSVPDGDALNQWRSWAAQTSGDPRERHTAPTVLLPNAPGGGVYLFRLRDAAPVPADLTLPLKGFTITTGDLVVPIPPTRLGGEAVTRLGPARILPAWLQRTLRDAAAPLAV